MVIDDLCENNGEKKGIDEMNEKIDDGIEKNIDSSIERKIEKDKVKE